MIFPVGLGFFHKLSTSFRHAAREGAVETVKEKILKKEDEKKEASVDDLNKFADFIRKQNKEMMEEWRR
jgi:hypothetical protein